MSFARRQRRLLENTLATESYGCRLDRRFTGGKLDSEGRAAARRRLHADRSFHLFDEPTHDRQAEARSRRLFIAPPKSLEYHFPLARGDARTVVDDFYRGARSDAHENSPVLRLRADSVFDQICNDAFDRPLYLSRPLAGPWRRALFFKRGAGPDRILFDLHRLTGAYVAPLALVIVVSGVCLIFGAQTGSLIAPFSYVSEHMLPRGLKSEPPRGRPPIGASAAATAVDGLFADGRLMSIAPPNGADGVYRVGKHADGEVYETETKRIVAVDQYSGAILWVQDPREFTVGERILEWRFPLHTGEAFGAGGRAVMTVFGFTPTVLFLTGVRWRRKKRARHVLSRS